MGNVMIIVLNHRKWRHIVYAAIFYGSVVLAPGLASRAANISSVSPTISDFSISNYSYFQLIMPSSRNNKAPNGCLSELPESDFSVIENRRPTAQLATNE